MVFDGPGHESVDRGHAVDGAEPAGLQLLLHRLVDGGGLVGVIEQKDGGRRGVLSLECGFELLLGRLESPFMFVGLGVGLAADIPGDRADMFGDIVGGFAGVGPGILQLLVLVVGPLPGPFNVAELAEVFLETQVRILSDRQAGEGQHQDDRNGHVDLATPVGDQGPDADAALQGRRLARVIMMEGQHHRRQDDDHRQQGEQHTQAGDLSELAEPAKLRKRQDHEGHERGQRADHGRAADALVTVDQGGLGILALDAGVVVAAEQVDAVVDPQAQQDGEDEGADGRQFAKQDERQRQGPADAHHKRNHHQRGRPFAPKVEPDDQQQTDQREERRGLQVAGDRLVVLLAVDEPAAVLDVQLLVVGVGVEALADLADLADQPVGGGQIRRRFVEPQDHRQRVLILGGQVLAVVVLSEAVVFGADVAGLDELAIFAFVLRIEGGKQRVGLLFFVADLLADPLPDRRQIVGPQVQKLVFFEEVLGVVEVRQGDGVELSQLGGEIPGELLVCLHVGAVDHHEQGRPGADALADFGHRLGGFGGLGQKRLKVAVDVPLGDHHPDRQNRQNDRRTRDFPIVPRHESVHESGDDIFNQWIHLRAAPTTWKGITAIRSISSLVETDRPIKKTDAPFGSFCHGSVVRGLRTAQNPVSKLQPAVVGTQQAQEVSGG